MEATDYEVRAIRFGILDLPSISITSGVVLSGILQTEEDLDFGRNDLRAGFASGTREAVVAKKVRDVIRTCRMVSSAFVEWQVEGEEQEWRFDDKRFAPKSVYESEILLPLPESPSGRLLIEDPNRDPIWIHRPLQVIYLFFT
jgi:hypothetical protein